MMSESVDAQQLTSAFKLLTSVTDWSAEEAVWSEFTDRPSTNSGFWCDPRVMRAESVPGAVSVLCAELRTPTGELAALVPFKYQSTQIPVRLGLATAGNIKAQCATLYDAPFAVAPGVDRTRIIERVVEELRQRHQCDIVVIPDWQTLADGTTPFARGVERRRQNSFRIELPPSSAAYLSALKRSTRHKLRGQVRKLEKTVGSLELKVFREPEQVPEFLAHAKSVWTKSWHAKFSDGLPSQEFMQAVAQYGWLRGYVLFGPNLTPLAIAIGYQYRGTYFYQNTAYDPEFRALSPGQVLNFLFVQDLADKDPPGEVNFGFGENQYKLVLCNQSVEQVETWFALSTRGQVIIRFLTLLDSVVSLGKRMMSDTPAVRWVKARLRRPSRASAGATADEEGGTEQ